MLPLCFLCALLALGRVHCADGLGLIDVDARGGRAAGAKNARASAGAPHRLVVRVVEQVDLLGHVHGAAEQVPIVRLLLLSAPTAFGLVRGGGSAFGCGLFRGDGIVVRDHAFAVVPNEVFGVCIVLLFGILHFVVVKQMDQFAVFIHGAVVLVVKFGVVVNAVVGCGSIVQQTLVIFQRIERSEQGCQQADFFLFMRLFLLPFLFCHGSPRVV